MSLQFSVLGSGSGGNSTLLVIDEETAPRRLLIDAGLSPRETARRLAQFDVTLDQIEAILLTHLDGDHLREGWWRTCQRLGIRIHVHKRHAARLFMRPGASELLQRFEDSFDLGPATRVDSILLAHDQLGTVGYRIEHHGTRLGFATDLGRVPDDMVPFFGELDALAIESNYDPGMQRSSHRPAFLKRRIMGGRGHLSNRQSIDAVLRIGELASLRHVTLLHLSRQCNDPGLIETLYQEHAPHLADRLTIAHQFEPTPLLNASRGSAAAPRPAGEPAGQMKLFRDPPGPRIVTPTSG